MVDGKSTFRGTAYLLLTLCLALSGCTNQNQMEPAKKAIADIEAAVAAAGADAQRYIADDLKAVNEELAELKAKFDKKDYADVVAAAPALLTKAQGLVAAKVTAAKEAAAREAAAQAAAAQALKDDWATLADTVPAAITNIDGRVNILTKSKKLPADLTKDAFESAQVSLDDAKTLWEMATNAHTGGNLRDAVANAQQAKAKSDAALASLGMGS